MINKFKPKSEFALNVLTLMTGSTIAQAIPIAISPILTRLYTPDEFGIFALYLSIAVIITVAASGRYELAVMLPKRKEDALNVLALSILIVSLISLLSFLVVLIFNKEISGLFDNQEISTWLYFIPISVLFTGTFNSFNYWHNRKKKYKRLATSKVLQTSTASLTNIGMGINGLGASGLVTGNILGRGIAAFVLGRFFWKEDKNLLKKINRLRMFVLLKKYKDFPTLNMPHSIFNSFSSELPVFLISYFFQNTITGFYSFANRVLLSPISVVTQSYAQVFLEKMTSLYNNRDDEDVFFKKTVSTILLYSFPVFLIMFVFAPQIFSFVFGENWRVTGIYAQILIPMLYLRFTGTIVSSVVIIYNQQKKAFIIEIINTVLRGTALVIGGISNNIILGLILFSTFSSLVTFYRLVWYSKIVKRSNDAS